MTPSRWLGIAVAWSGIACVLLFATSSASTAAIVWLLGMIMIVVSALSANNGAQVTIHGPHGQAARVSEREALRRVTGEGWSYSRHDEQLLPPNAPATTTGDTGDTDDRIA